MTNFVWLFRPTNTLVEPNVIVCVFALTVGVVSILAVAGDNRNLSRLAVANQWYKVVQVRT